MHNIFRGIIFMRLIIFVIYYLVIHPVIIIYNGIFYIRYYFIIKKLVSNRLQFHLTRCSSHVKHSKAKLLIATTYASLAAKVVSDVINMGNSDITERREFIAIIDLYFLVVITDNFVDNSEVHTQKEKIDIAFANIDKLIQNPDNYQNVQISPDLDKEVAFFVNEYRDLWKDEYKEEFTKTINSIRRAYLFEVSSNSSLKKSWQSLYRISRVTISLYETINYFIYKKKINCPAVRTNLYHFAFSGNIIDDWMDYYWTQEDVGKNCFLLLLSKHHNIRYETGVIFNLVTFCSSFYMLSKRLSKIRFNTLSYIRFSWIIPTFSFVVIVVSPISIWTHLREK